MAVLSCAILALAIFNFMHWGSGGGHAPETGCMANLDAIRKSMAGYASENDGKYPFATDNPATPTSTNQNDGLAWFAREMGLPGKTFVCPATDDGPLVTGSDIPGAENDFYSYAYQAPFLENGVLTVGVTDDTLNGVIFLSDKPPRSVGPVDWGALLAEDQRIEDLDESDPNRTALMAAMSPHHRDGEVMMVASKAGVQKAGRGDVGHNNDAIFMGAGPGSPGTPATSITDRQGSLLLGRQDSLLLRPDGQ